MTGMPFRRAGATVCLKLVCDGCGEYVATALGPDDWPLAWSAAQRHGWRGREQALGPHFCPDCADARGSTVQAVAH